MIRIYAVENATQRGNTSTAMGGSVASAIRFLAKIILTGNCQKFLTVFDLEKQGPKPDAANIGQREKLFLTVECWLCSA